MCYNLVRWCYFVAFGEWVVSENRANSFTLLVVITGCFVSTTSFTEAVRLYPLQSLRRWCVCVQCSPLDGISGRLQFYYYVFRIPHVCVNMQVVTKLRMSASIHTTAIVSQSASQCITQYECCVALTLLGKADATTAGCVTATSEWRKKKN